MADQDTHDRIERIQRRAYELWEAAGKPEGQDEHFWQIAERLIDSGEAAGPERQ